MAVTSSEPNFCLSKVVIKPQNVLAIEKNNMRVYRHSFNLELGLLLNFKKLLGH